MKKLLKAIIFLFIGLFLVVRPTGALDFPASVGYVNDFANILSPSFASSLDSDLRAFDAETTAEVVVVTIESLEGYNIDDYAVRLFENWKIGKKEKDNGILVLVSKSDRKMRIEVGYGLEPVVTDGRAGRIIRDQISPAFKEGDYDKGIGEAIEEIKGYIRSGEAPSGLEKTQEKANQALGVVIFMIVIFVYFISFVFRVAGSMARSKKVWPGGLAGAVLGGVFGLIAGLVIFWILFFGIFGLLLDWVLSRNYKKLKKAGKSTGFWSSKGGFWSGGRGFGSGGGGGGFSGGGGSSGGGGASGGW